MKRKRPDVDEAEDDTDVVIHLDPEGKPPGVDEAGDNTDILIKLDPTGDAVLNVFDGTIRRRLRVSSKVLSLASPVFQRLFASSTFLEGTKLAESGFVEVPLNEHNSTTMWIMLKILHFQGSEIIFSRSPNRIAEVAICCQKYDCTKTFRPWLVDWYHHKQRPFHEKHYGYILLAAEICECTDLHLSIIAEVWRNIVPHFSIIWAEIGILGHLSETTKDTITKNIEKLKASINRAIQDVELSLRESRRGYVVEGKLCLKCENTYVDPTRMYRMCPQCKNYSAMYPRVCISETRVSEYCRALKRSRLWPSLHHDQHCSAQDLADRVSRAKTELDHKCDALSSCPLVKELDKLDEKCQGILYSDPNCESSDTRSSDLKRGDVE